MRGIFYMATPWKLITMFVAFVLGLGLPYACVKAVGLTNNDDASVIAIPTQSDESIFAMGNAPALNELQPAPSLLFQVWCYVYQVAPDTLYVIKGVDTPMEFQVNNAPGPVSWTVSPGVTCLGHRETPTPFPYYVADFTLSNEIHDVRTITATSGSWTQTVNIVVCEAWRIISPEDTFVERSFESFGVGEEIHLGFEVYPIGVTASQLRGLSWIKDSGNGSLNTNSNQDGTGTYTCARTADVFYLRLAQHVCGTTYIDVDYFNGETVIPDGVYFEVGAGSGTGHSHNKAGVGMVLSMWLTPNYVSFYNNVRFKELACSAIISSDPTDWYHIYSDYMGGLPHVPGSPLSTRRRDSTAPDNRGSVLNGYDLASQEPYLQSGFANSTMTWQIPNQFQVGSGSWSNFSGDAVTPQVFSIDGTGKMTITKGAESSPASAAAAFGDNDSGYWSYVGTIANISGTVQVSIGAGVSTTTTTGNYVISHPWIGVWNWNGQNFTVTPLDLTHVPPHTFNPSSSTVNISPFTGDVIVNFTEN
jgi:hypothetical protein